MFQINDWIFISKKKMFLVSYCLIFLKHFRTLLQNNHLIQYCLILLAYFIRDGSFHSSSFSVGIAAHSTLLHDKENPANIHLHASQVWTYGVKAIGSRSLFEVVVHEIGHVFGIGHNDVKGEPTAVMTTGHRNYVPPDHFDLTKADINALKNTAFGKLLKKKNLLKEHCSGDAFFKTKRAKFKTITDE